MKNLEKHMVGWLAVCLMLCSSPVWAQGDAGDYLTIVGQVKDKQNKKALENVNVSVYGSNIGTVTNAEGEFALKIKKTEAPRELEISHIGYANSHISIEKEAPAKLTVWMTPHANLLNEVVVYASDPRLIVEKAISKIPQNYSDKRDMLTGFYRETVQKGRRYIGISEAVLDVSKTAYTNRNINYDKVRVMKGRRLLSQKASDTLAVKVVGGPNLSVTLDVVKNNEALLDLEELNNYEFWMAESVLIDNRMQYVINFRPKVILMYALLYGKLYIDRERLSFTRAEMSLDMQNKSKATTAILYKKPLGLRFKPQELSYLVTYKNVDGRTYLNYIRNTIRFKCDWKRKLFSTSYAITSEMVVTDRKEGSLETIPNKEAFNLTQIFYDKVDEYWSEGFWGNYNIIEPTESLEHAVDKLKKQAD
ncbi:carboxypeptidase-like regulatory domain-containing protein [Bacteroides congonensis]|uniref:carboxypeptidase-like regulatory domain-containing protein n=1 Tax=Bacteroides congonensis TaxID=1871006 RepID=UPI0023F745BE|nr:carboxypeptidase-like regulatory domain-containing protein [Bacteroides congonensis]